MFSTRRTSFGHPLQHWTDVAARRADNSHNRPMTGGAEPAARRVVNSVTGDVNGNLVQAGRIEGGVHHHYPPPDQRAIEWPYRYGTVPARAAAFQRRSVRGLQTDTFGADQTTMSPLSSRLEDVVTMRGCR